MLLILHVGIAEAKAYVAGVNVVVSHMAGTCPVVYSLLCKTFQPQKGLLQLQRKGAKHIKICFVPLLVDVLMNLYSFISNTVG